MHPLSPGHHFLGFGLFLWCARSLSCSMFIFSSFLWQNSLSISIMRKTQKIFSCLKCKNFWRGGRWHDLDSARLTGLNLAEQFKKSTGASRIFFTTAHFLPLFCFNNLLCSSLIILTNRTSHILLRLWQAMQPTALNILGYKYLR